ncbi:hypothetical protein Bca52824_053572 [Brassica carinata]|uniref:Bulb-type lectin domain-containing protein n=1 Tax=Brassica carinata TaxID=52824 RepID=A0A8X7R682_BRACI|nr:hypothetical protein Bca52824_053572 [Brassica carinata]
MENNLVILNESRDLIWSRNLSGSVVRTDTWNGYQFGNMALVFQLNDNADSFLMKTFPNSNSSLTMVPCGVYDIHTWVPGITVKYPVDYRASRTFKNSTLVSPNKLFELGFFQSQNKWYLGKRWKQDTDKTILWVANRNVPLLESYGVLKFMENNLVILNESRDLIWSRNLSGSVVRSPMLAELLDNGTWS